MARAATLIISILLFVGCLVDVAGADDRARLDESFEITADRITYDDARDLYVAENHVRVVQTTRSLKARWIAFSTTTRIGVAQGDVELLDGPDRLQAEFMVFDVDTLQGMLFQGSLDAGSEGFKVRAQELIRTGKNTFTVRDGVFSTCRCPDSDLLPWQIRAKDAEVELGGYGTVKNSTFEVLGVPVLWIPWAFFPVKSERETGLLLPDFAFGGRGGAAFGLPFFWAALPQLNVTLTPRYFTERGYKQDAELEYVFGEQSAGQLFVAGLHDEQAGKSDGYSKTRWAVLWDHDQHLPAELRWQTDLKLSSDNLYSDDFTELRHYKAFRFVESTTNLARDFGASGGFAAMAAARYADDIQGSTFDDGDEYILQRGAELRGDVLPGTFVGPFGVEARFDSELIYYSGLRTVASEIPNLPRALRTNGRFYDIGINGRVDGVDTDGEGDGIFQPGEPLAERGTRIVLHPRLARPMRLGRFAEFVPEIGWQQSLYQTNGRRFAERGLLTARSELRGRFARDYLGEEGRAVRHVIEPQLGWVYVSQTRQLDNPQFVPRGSVAQSRYRALSLENVTRNPSDRIESANQLVLGLNQRFFVRQQAGRAPRLRAELMTAIDWDFTGDGGLGDIFVEGRVFYLGPFSSRLRGAFNPETVAVKEGTAELSFGLPVSNSILRSVGLGTRYRYLRRVPEFFETVRGEPNRERQSNSALNQIDLTTRFEFTARVRLSYRAIYSIVDNEFIRNRGIVEYVSKCLCWGVGASVFHERRQGFGGGFEIRFLGLGDEKSNLFDGGFGAGMNL